MRLRRQRVSLPVSSDILTVCTGNICRSAFLEALLRQRHPMLTIRSAGTGALVGSPVPPEISGLLADRGIGISHVGAQLTREQVQGARLIITATAEHRTTVVSLDTSAADRSFTLRELARLLQAPPSHGRGIEAVLDTARSGLRHGTGEEADDLADPYRRPIAAYARMAEEVEKALSVIDPWLG